MASDKRASMREGPLAALFARTEPKKKNEPPAKDGPHATPAERLRDAFAGDRRRDPATRAGQLELERNGGTMTPKAGGPVLRVVGVGGAGTNAVDRMIEAEVVGVDFLAVNTDLQSLQQSGADLTLAIGQRAHPRPRLRRRTRGRPPGRRSTTSTAQGRAQGLGHGLRHRRRGRRHRHRRRTGRRARRARARRADRRDRHDAVRVRGQAPRRAG